MKGHRPSITDDQKFRMTIVRSLKIFKGIILQAQLIRQLAQSDVSVAQLIRRPVKSGVSVASMVTDSPATQLFRRRSNRFAAAYQLRADATEQLI